MRQAHVRALLKLHLRPVREGGSHARTVEDYLLLWVQGAQVGARGCSPQTAQGTVGGLLRASLAGRAACMLCDCWSEMALQQWTCA